MQKVTNLMTKLSFFQDTLIVSKMLDGVTSFEHFNTAGGYRVVNTGSFQNLPTVQTFKILDLELQPYEPSKYLQCFLFIRNLD